MSTTVQCKPIFNPTVGSSWRNECSYRYFVRVRDDALVISGSSKRCEEYPEDWRERVALLDAAWEGQKYPNVAYIPGVGCVCLDSDYKNAYLPYSRLAYLFEKP